MANKIKQETETLWRRELPKPGETRLQKQMRFWRSISFAAVLLGIFSLVGEYGFRGSQAWTSWLRWGGLAAGAVLVVSRLALWGCSHRPVLWKYFPWLEMALLSVLVVCLFHIPARMPQFSPSEVRWIIFQIYLLILIALLFARSAVAATTYRIHPTQVMITSFILVIFTGAILLMFPSAHRLEKLDFTDAVFTATSATCVTGLTVLDTGGDFSRFGQIVVLTLIQIGGLGIMIFGTLFAYLLGSPLSLRESMAMRDLMNEQNPGRIGRIVGFICVSAFAIETIGVFFMVGMWQTDSLRGGQWFNSVFHSVSAFCNAGFSLQRENLMAYRFSWQTYGVICTLIILGGLGFPVLMNLFEMVYTRLNIVMNKAPAGDISKIRLGFHSRIVLCTTGALLVGGFLALAFMEYFRPDRAEVFSPANLMDCWFNSVTARTAGFNTVDIKGLGAGAKLILIFLMVVGGSPSSTAGGIKTTGLAIMVLMIVATMRRREQVHLFHRTISAMTIRRAATLILLYGLLLGIIALLLTITEHSSGRDLLDLLFESASALGTVGLSTGVTGHLTTAGKWVIILAMLVGRLGPLSLLTALSFNVNPARYEYPRGTIVIG